MRRSGNIIIYSIMPRGIINTEKRSTDNEKIMTSTVISAGIDMSLYIVKKLDGISVTETTISYMEYNNQE